METLGRDYFRKREEDYKAGLQAWDKARFPEPEYNRHSFFRNPNRFFVNLIRSGVEKVKRAFDKKSI